MPTILALAANPRNTARLRLENEINQIEDQLILAGAPALEIIRTGAVQVQNLPRLFLKHNPTIVHFSGHGSSEDELLLEDNSGDSNPVNSAQIAETFRLLKGRIRCVFLNSCYSISQANEIAKYIDCVIGMSSAIEDKTAIVFSKHFYSSVGGGCSIKKAFDLACNISAMEHLTGANVPVLIAPNVDPDTVFISGKPEIHCEFEMTNKNKIKRSDDGYHIVKVSVINAPRETVSVFYHLNEITYEETDTAYTDVMSNPMEDFPVSIEATNNFEIRAVVWFSRDGIGMKSFLCQSLWRHYGSNPSEEIRSAIQYLEDAD